MNRSLIATLIGMGIGLGAVAQESAVAPQEDDDLSVLPAFKAVDANEDGTTDASEADALTKTLEQEHQIQFQFESVDADRDGLIDSQEYVAYDRMLQKRLGIG